MSAAAWRATAVGVLSCTLLIKRVHCDWGCVASGTAATGLFRNSEMLSEFNNCPVEAIKVRREVVVVRRCYGGCIRAVGIAVVGMAAGV